MKASLTKGLDKDEAKEITMSFASSLIVRKRLIHLLESRIEEGRRVTSGKELYESPNWAMRQADQIGYERAMRELISLLS